MTQDASTATPSTPIERATDTAPTPNALAHLMTGAEGLGPGRAEATALLEVLIDNHPSACRSREVLVRMAQDAGLPTTGSGWAASATITQVEYDQLLALGEGSSWAAPGFLIDPDGSRGAELAVYLRIARARLERGESGASGRHVEWLARATERENLPTAGCAARSTAALAAWPFNADGDMDGPDGEPYRMILGALSPVEIQFRAKMAAIRERTEAAPDDLRRARGLALGLLQSVQAASLRMSGLAQAALARIYSIQAQVVGHRLPPLEGLPTLDGAALFLERSERLLAGSGKGTAHDRRGLAGLRGAIDAQQAMDGDRVVESATSHVDAGGDMMTTAA